MPCFVSCLALFAPRLALVLVWLTSGYLGRAFETVLWPVLGFVFMPYTTLAYAWAFNSGGGTISGLRLVVVVVAVLVDLGVVGGSGEAERRRRARA